MRALMPVSAMCRLPLSYNCIQVHDPTHFYSPVETDNCSNAHAFFTNCLNGSYSSVVRGYGLGGRGLGFNPHPIRLSGLEVRPFKVSGGSPVHLRSKHWATKSGN